MQYLYMYVQVVVITPVCVFAQLCSPTFQIHEKVLVEKGGFSRFFRFGGLGSFAKQMQIEVFFDTVHEGFFGFPLQQRVSAVTALIILYFTLNYTSTIFIILYYCSVVLYATLC